MAVKLRVMDKNKALPGWWGLHFAQDSYLEVLGKVTEFYLTGVMTPA